MNPIIDAFKERLKTALDEGFPKIEEEGPEKVANKRGPALALYAEAVIVMQEAIEAGRVSVLKDFDNLCAADAIMGFSDAEVAAIKKFFQWNKDISGWDK